MLIGAMNHPQRELMGEIQWMGQMGLDFIDLTLEPPAAASWRVDLAAVRDAIHKANLKVVGHTAYYLPLASPFEEVRQAAVLEARRCMNAFAILGAQWMNIHPDRHIPMHDRAFVIRRNLQSMKDLLETSRQVGVGLMIENLPGAYNNARELGELLEPLPELGLHLDIGHTNLMVEKNSADELLAQFGSRLRHVHLHDNRGGNQDLHLPLGTGTVDCPHYVQLLKKMGYDGTITLEVFSEDRHYLAYSRDLLRKMWEDKSEIRNAKSE